jgi:hypothetical protein
MSNTQTSLQIDEVLNFSEIVGTVPAETNSIQRAIEVLFRPQSVWSTIAQEKGGLKEALLPYTFIVGFVPMLFGSVMCSMIYGTFAALMGSPTAVLSLPGSVFGCAVHFAYSIAGILISAKILELVAPSFGLRRSWVLSTRALVYGSTPTFAAFVVSWIPILGALVGWVAFLWTIYLTIAAIKSLLAI